METSQTTTPTPATVKNKRQPRSRPLPPDVNARNLAIEKRRREDMNRIFSDLAGYVRPCVPNKRVSKRLLVIESLRHLRHQREMCIAAGKELRELLSSHNDLIAEVNTLRSQLGITVTDAPRPPSTAFLSLMDVENQTYGKLPNASAGPSASEIYEPEPTGVRQREAFTSLPESPAPLNPVTQIQTSTQAYPLNYLDGARDVVSPEDWQAQTSSYFLTSSGVHGAPTLGMDWWESNVSGLNLEVPLVDSPLHMLPWDEACNNVLQQHSDGTFVPFPQ